MNSRELLDVLMESGEPTGDVRLRDEVHRLGLWHRTVHVWITNGKKELLLQKRSSAKETFPGAWDVSAAGHISAGDSSLAAALREVEEELGVRALPQELTLLFTIRQQFHDTARGIFENEITDVYLLQRDLGEDDIALDPGEVECVRWIGIGELKKSVIDDRDPSFAPHGEEYMRLFEALT